MECGTSRPTKQGRPQLTDQEARPSLQLWAAADLPTVGNEDPPGLSGTSCPHSAALEEDPLGPAEWRSDIPGGLGPIASSAHV